MKMLTIYWLCAISYVLLANIISYPLDFAHKALPALILAAWLGRIKFKFRNIAICALVFCAAGDMFLALSFPQSFIVGLVAFLIGHLAFAAFFCGWIHWAPAKIYILILLALATLIIGALLLPYTGKMLLPVTIYILAITLMTATAILAAKDSSLLILGAAIFMLSDMLIAVNKFVSSIPAEHFAIMLSYYLALYLLTTGIVERSKSDKDNKAL